jgi:A/G-specific adenine glycosylase
MRRKRATNGSKERGGTARSGGLSPDGARRIQATLLRWYGANRRDLPWRRTSDPYAIWVSEAMLQQTQVATVRGYYERWMERFPTVLALADSSESDVLHAWQGLGYYSRAKNLLRGAQTVARRHGGKLPETANELRALPGIGPYSAGAIASIAYGERVPLVDGNVVRVLSRLFGLRGDPTRAPLKKRLWQVADELVPAASPGDFNQALMELGATVCSPRAPKCDACPLRTPCEARSTGVVDELPELPRRRASVAVARAAAVVWHDGRVLVVRVPADSKRWAGFWKFPNVDVAPKESAEDAARRAARAVVSSPVRSAAPLLTVRHSVTHHRITLDVFRCDASPTARARSKSESAWRRPDELDELPMPAPDRRIARHLRATPPA